MRFIWLLLLLTACSQPPHSAPKENPGTITLVFDAHQDYRNIFPEGIVQYVDDHYIKQNLRPNQEGDTLSITTHRDFLELTHQYPYQENDNGPISYSQLHYILQKGDTVRFTYKRFAPHAEVLNREVLPYDLNYNLASWPQLYERNAPVRNFMFEFQFNPDWTEEEQETNFLRHVDMINKQDLAEMAREDAFLDSLFETALISEQAYSYHKAINYFRVMDRDMKRARVDRYVNQTGLDGMQEHEGVQTADYIPRLNIEELATVGSILYALDDYVAYRFQVPTVSETYDGSGFRYPDYPVKFDSTLQASWLSQQMKEALLLNDLKGIMKEYPVAYRFRYLSKFKAFVSDTAMVNHIATQYAIEAGEEEDILLEDLDGNTQTFSELMARHAGKVVYVDWWASWCGPCFQVMPDLYALEDSLSGKKAVILYISIDETNDLWKISADSFLSGTEQNSYRVSNKFVSKQFESFNIQYIPRYFLIDQQGKVVHEYAPGPAEEQLVTMITELLKNSAE